MRNFGVIGGSQFAVSFTLPGAAVASGAFFSTAAAAADFNAKGLKPCDSTEKWPS
jgi:hypothetical protein